MFINTDFDQARGCLIMNPLLNPAGMQLKRSSEFI
jgi:hypothetical protein